MKTAKIWVWGNIALSVPQKD